MKKSTQKKIIKTIKKTNKSILICFVLFLIIGFASGFIGVKYLTQNDRFEIIGLQTIELDLNEEYVDEGAIAIEFNKNISNEIVVEDLDKINTSVAGKYVITYKLNSKRYKDIKRIRYVVVLESGDANE